MRSKYGQKNKECYAMKYKFQNTNHIVSLIKCSPTVINSRNINTVLELKTVFVLTFPNELKKKIKESELPDRDNSCNQVDTDN